MTSITDLAALRREEFGALPDGYLNSASMGPLPARSVAVLGECNADRARPGTWPLERLNAILDGAEYHPGTWCCYRSRGNAD